MLKTSTKRVIFFFLLSIIFIPITAQGSYFHREEILKAVPGCTVGIVENDTLLIQRLLLAYRNSDNTANRGNSMWQFFFCQRHAEIHQIFINGPFEVARDLLRNPAGSDLFYGIDTLCKCFLHQFQNPKTSSSFAKLCHDQLIRVAEAIGALRLDNLEGYYHPPISYDTETILQVLEHSLGIELKFPNPYPYEYGVQSSKGLISSRAPQALYQAWKIKQLVKDIENPRVLEIGAGVGRTAYFATLMGIKDYTIVDLPFTAICSGYFLGRSLGENQILLHGETSLEGTENKIKILTPQDFFNSLENYDLIVNVDSMTEMDPVMARLYFKKIESSTNMFLSINHENNTFTIADLIRENPSIALAKRNPYWLRKGYVEELVIFKNN